jgi:hypothetical protein
MCSPENSGDTQFSRSVVHMSLLSKVGGDETMVAGKVVEG